MSSEIREELFCCHCGKHVVAHEAEVIVAGGVFGGSRPGSNAGYKYVYCPKCQRDELGAVRANSAHGENWGAAASSPVARFALRVCQQLYASPTDGRTFYELLHLTHVEEPPALADVLIGLLELGAVELRSGRYYELRSIWNDGLLADEIKARWPK